jgi:TolA-binding protein
MRRVLERLAILLALSAGAAAPARAHDATTTPDASQAPAADAAPITTDAALHRYYTQLADRRLVASETGSQRQLGELVVHGQELVIDHRYDEAALVLFEACESPRFADFEGSDDATHAEYLLGGALLELGAHRTAAHYLLRILRRGADAPYFGPAYRRVLDVALRGAELPSILASLEEIGEAGLSDDSLNELRYLRGRARYDANDLPGADTLFATVGRRSRFYANAQYLRGVIATRAGQLREAEQLFCSIATTPDTDRFTFYVDRRYFDVRDLTWLALGRVAHEGGRADDAFYYYFQVPEDSHRVSEALFEGAWAMYEGHDAETAVDLLDQLETRFPASPFVDEATLLRGYVHLDRCEFEEANRLFVHFAEIFEPIRDEVERILATDSRRERIAEELLAAESSAETPVPHDGEVAARPDARTMLLGLLRVDPTFYRLDAELRMLDAESARSARLADQIGAIEVRLTGADAPEAAVAQTGSIEDDTANARHELETARASLRAMADQLDAMRAQGAPAERLAPLETEVQGLQARLREIETHLSQALTAHAQQFATASDANAEGLEAQLRADRDFARAFSGRTAAVRARLVAAVNAYTVRALETLRARLGSSLRRARIGRIDAVMGSKRRIELQIESLSAGRFPPELLDPLRIQGLLRDDEEYWPFEGELWRDEFEEDESGSPETPAAPAAETTPSEDTTEAQPAQADGGAT